MDHVGIVQGGRALTVEDADGTWGIYNEDGLVAEVASMTKPIARSRSTNRNHPATESIGCCLHLRRRVERLAGRRCAG
jgi:hypothetical protein